MHTKKETNKYNHDDDPLRRPSNNDTFINDDDSDTNNNTIDGISTASEWIRRDVGLIKVIREHAEMVQNKWYSGIPQETRKCGLEDSRDGNDNKDDGEVTE